MKQRNYQSQTSACSVRLMTSERLTAVTTTVHDQSHSSPLQRRATRMQSLVSRHCVVAVTMWAHSLAEAPPL